MPLPERDPERLPRIPDTHKPDLLALNKIAPSAFRARGFTILRKGGATRTRPCDETVGHGPCFHVGLFVPLCETEQEARDLAGFELGRDTRTELIDELLWVFPLEIQATAIRDLTGTLTAAEAEWIVYQLYWTATHKEQVWSLVNEEASQGVLLPTNPRTLFLTERHHRKVATLGEPEEPPISAPAQRPHNVLDYVAPDGVPSAVPPKIL